MPGATHNGQAVPSVLEALLRVHGDFRTRLEPLGVTPLQAGVLLYLQRTGASKLKDACVAVAVKPPTLNVVINDLARKGWVIKQRAGHDNRALCLRLSPQGVSLARRIQGHVRKLGSSLTSLKEASL